MPSPGVKVATFLDHDTFQELKEFCDREERSLSWYIKKAVETTLACEGCPASRFPDPHDPA